jgi:hypothetical protein
VHANEQNDNSLLLVTVRQLTDSFDEPPAGSQRRRASHTKAAVPSSCALVHANEQNNNNLLLVTVRQLTD